MSIRSSISQFNATLGRRGLAGSAVLLGSLVALGGGLMVWKRWTTAQNAASFAAQPEPAEAVTVAVAEPRSYQPTTTAIGTVLALRSVTLRNEIPGTVRYVALNPGEVVEPGTVLVALDVSVERAELASLEARAALASTSLERYQKAARTQAVSQLEVDRARAERDVALAEIARIKAVIGRKTIRAPFRARVGIADVHPGQYLEGGTLLTTLQGVDPAAHLEFTVSQTAAELLEDGDTVTVRAPGQAAPTGARIVALDARVDPATRNTLVRARIDRASPAPGASVRVEVPVGQEQTAVAVPVSALRKGPAGDHVFVIAPDGKGAERASLRPVRSGTVLGDQVIILTGLKAGERVASSGSFKLRESALVTVTPSPAGKLSASH